MIEFFAALLLFFAAHVIPARTNLATAAKHRLGARLYLVLYSLVSIGLLGWLISAAQHAPYIALWTPPDWAYMLPIGLMPVSFILLGTALTQPNPLSIAFSHRPFDPHRPGVVALTRHPVLWNFGIWAGAHIPPNGDLVSVVLFGVLALFAFAGMALIDHKKRGSLGEAYWHELAAPTSILPGLALIKGRARWPGDRTFYIAAALGLGAYFVFLTSLHERLFGVAPLLRIMLEP